jgi:lipopolysaccharide transport system ATP-binding protein
MTAIIRAENVGKRYEIGASMNAGYATLREAFVGAIRTPFARLRGEAPPPVQEKWAVRNVTFDVRQGEVLGIIGHNGAGKSTLLKILSRITHPTEGSIDLYGRVGSLLEVGTGFHGELSGRENIFLNGSIIGMTRKEIERKFDEIVAFAEVAKYIDVPVKRYSNGMQVRLAFAVAAHLEPEILIIDEVLAVGDASFQRKCLGKMGDVAKEGRTVLFVSHDLAAVRHLCGRVILLEGGRITMGGDPGSVIDSYIAKTHGESTAWRVDTQRLVTNGPLKITSIELLDGDRTPLRQLHTGGPLIVRIAYSVAPDVIIPALAFTIVVKTRLGTHVLRLNNEYTGGFPMMEVSGSGTVDVILPVVPFGSGEYVIDFLAGTRPEGRYASLSEIVSFSVGEQDVYGTGKIVAQNQSIVALPHRWIHVPESSESSDSGWVGEPLGFTRESL